MIMEPIFPQVVVTMDLSGEAGNAFCILATVCAEMRREGIVKADIDKFQQEATSGDYQNLFDTCCKWIRFRTGKTIILLDDEQIVKYKPSEEQKVSRKIERGLLDT